MNTESPSDTDTFDYVVVGSGAGGGPLAANLALAGFSVVLLEAGGDHEGLSYSVPAFHPIASEDPDMAWNYFVRHYSDEAQQRRDSKFVPAHDGIFYPRAGTLGGCTAHNAMITVYPCNSDWDHLAELTGDSTWRSDRMRQYFERLECCEYIVPPGAYPKNRLRAFLLWLIRGFGLSRKRNPSRHGFDGWLPTTGPDPSLALHDLELIRMVEAEFRTARQARIFGFLQVLEDVLAALRGLLWRGDSAIDALKGHLDPNDWRVVRASREAIVFIPIATRDGSRSSVRDRIRQAQQDPRGGLNVRLNALATKVLLDAQNRATGVEYLEGAHLYRADPRAQSTQSSGQMRTVFARREVILAGGAFNSPQLLMLSGIGPKETLEKFGIPVRVNLPGVGQNLQDRYEITVISEMKSDFVSLLEGSFKVPAPGDPPDPCLEEWLTKKTGLYTSNGGSFGIIKKSRPERSEPDLFLFGVPGMFRGYFPGYSQDSMRKKCVFTWAILKAHTRNTAGYVTLRSADPRHVPEINFRYFGEGNDKSGDDLESVVEGVQFVRRISENARFITRKEVWPGQEITTADSVRDWIKNEAWGHHACGTCKIGRKDDPRSVLDSQFRVRGTKNLRVVDASVFPRIPGFFIVTPIYMVSEKASDVILEAAKNTSMS